MYAVIKRNVYFVVVHARVDGRRRNTAPFELRHLVFHEGNERRNNHANAFLRQHGQLKTQRLATARGQQRQRIAPRQDGLNDVLLQRTKRRVTPVFF